MNLLIDTHIFLWIFAEPHRFTARARSFFEDTDSNQFFLSDACVWEATIKFGLGRLKLPDIPELFFADRVRQAGYRHLRIDLSHVTKVYSLDQIHRDPFDRLLITQASVENMPIVTNDPVFSRYRVKTFHLRDIS